MSAFKWRQFAGEVILWAVRWYCRYGVSYREHEAQARGCHSAWLDTSRADAYAFYLRLGYDLLAALENRPGQPPEGHRRWLLRKSLA